MNKKMDKFDVIIARAKIEEPEPRRFLIKKKLIESFEEFSHSKDIRIENLNINKKFETACVIAFQDRHQILKLNLELLYQQSLRPAVILVASKKEDIVFANSMIKKYDNVFLTVHQNYPIGGKWHQGVLFAKNLKVNGLMILGSDDLLSLNYFKYCYEKIGRGKGSLSGFDDLVGNRRWYIYDVSKKMYELCYNNSVEICLGGGRMFSKYFLDSCRWEIFRKYRPVHLDEEGFFKVKNFSGKISIVPNENFILSIKGSWNVLNSTEDILKAKNKIKWSELTPNKANNIIDLLKIRGIDDYTT